MSTALDQAKTSESNSVEKGESLWVGAWYRLRKNKMALAGGMFILILFGISFIGPFFLAENYFTDQELDAGKLEPRKKRIINLEISASGNGFSIGDILKPVGGQSNEPVELRVDSVTADGAI